MYAPSRLFTLSYQYAKCFADQIYILSAKYGLLSESDVVSPYDLTLVDLPKHRQRDWANYVLSQMRDRFDLAHDEFIILAGQNYYQNLLPHLSHATLPLGNLRIGARIMFLQQQLAQPTPSEPTAAQSPHNASTALCLYLHRLLTALPRYTWEEISSVPFRNGICPVLYG